MPRGKKARDPVAECFTQAKQVFRKASQPSRLVGREKEHAVIEKFLKNYVLANRAGSLYISGAPGTGKTASLLRICMGMKADLKRARHPIKLVVMNCMSVATPRGFYERLASDLVGQPVASKDALAVLETLFLDTKRKSLYLLVLDEIDSLLSRDQEVLYKLFEWPTLPGSRLVLVGIANALDLTDRFLPRLRAKGCMPQLLNFLPYQMEDIIAIIKARLDDVYATVMGTGKEVIVTRKSTDSGKGISDADQATQSLANLGLVECPPLIETPAVELCARKVAASTGDLRKALDICRQAVEYAEQGYTKQSPSASQSNSSSPLFTTSPVTIIHMLKVLQSAFGTPTITKIRGLNFHQKLVLCTAALHTSQKRAALTLGKLYDIYDAQCKSTASISAVSRLEFFDLVTTLESFGLLNVAASRSELSRRVTLSVQLSELAHAVQDTPVLNTLMVDQD
ncbi:AAA ATPase [Dispira simplex]|nr:AAA ATPase [Dispira simplex]